MNLDPTLLERLLGSEVMLRDISLSASAELVCVRGCCARVGRDLMVRVDLDPRQPLELPIVSIENHASLGLLPHLTQAGVICYHEREGSVHSLEQPERVVCECVAMALRTLEEALEGKRELGFAEEAEWWWSRQPGIIHVQSFVEPSGWIKRIRRVRHFNPPLLDLPAQIIDLVVDSTRSSKHIDHDESVADGLFVPLQGSIHGDPRHALTVTGLRGLLQRSLCAKARRDLRRRLRRNKRIRFLLLGLPRPSRSGDVALVGLMLDETDRASLAEYETTRPSSPLTPFVPYRMDQPRLLARGGASLNLARHHVAIIGCGAVGGYVAHALARSGIGEVTLVDPDVLAIENCYRHVCGQLGVAGPKVAVLRALLTVTQPYLRCHAEHMHVEDFLATPKSASPDLYVVAVGNPTLSRWIHRALRNRGKPAVFTWLEPLGLGGHAFADPSTPDAGCFECLFRAPDGSEQLTPRCEFAAPNQNTLERLGGCGASFSPYSDLDARTTADLAARLALQVLRASPSTTLLRSWKGDATEFEARGLRLTARFHCTLDELAAQQTATRHAACPLCSG